MVPVEWVDSGKRFIASSLLLFLLAVLWARSGTKIISARVKRFLSLDVTKYVNILKHQKYPLRFVASRILWKTRLCSLLEIKRPRYVIKFSPTSLCASLWVDPQDRDRDEQLFAKYLREGDCVIDVGANIGNLTLTAASVVGPKGRVYSIEPHPRIYGVLKKNIALNRLENVWTFNVVLGERKDVAMFSDVKFDDQNRVLTGLKGREIEMQRLDDLPITEQTIHLLKVDVEGYEKFVLEGARGVLARTSCVYFECWDQHFANFGYKSGDLFSLLVDLGFKLFNVLDEGSISAIRDAYASKQLENILAVREPKDFLRRANFACKG